jgi:hypothetical protein
MEIGEIEIGALTCPLRRIFRDSFLTFGFAHAVLRMSAIVFQSCFMEMQLLLDKALYTRPCS